MATISYKYIPLGDPDVTSNQSRGLSYQFNGYAPVTFKDSVSDYLSGLSDPTIPSFNTIIESCRGTVLFSDLSYVATDGYPVSNSTSYRDALKSPGAHMFKNLNVESAKELQLIGEDKVPHGVTTIEISISDTMMGDRLSGRAIVNAIVLYGQAYNLDFYSSTQQGKLENSVPIGIILFDDDSIDIDPTNPSKAETSIRVELGISSKDVPDEIYQSPEFEKWKKFSASMHVVNNDILTNSAFVIRGKDIEVSDDLTPDGTYAEHIIGGEVVDCNSRVFFTNDIGDGSDWERNVSFGSPAKVTVLNRSEPISDDTRIPQTVVGKVKYWKDNLGYEHACLEGVHQSFFEYAGTENSGAVYEKDWFAKNKPAVNLFSSDTNFQFADSEYGDAATSACFANGTNIISKRSQSCGEGLNVSTTDVSTIGNTVVINSTDVKSLTRPMSDEDKAAYPERVKYDTVVLNSEKISIKNKSTGSISQTTNPQTTVLNSKEITIENDGSEVFVNTMSSSVNTVLGSEKINLRENDRVVVLGSHGSGGTLYSNSYIGCTKDSVVIGGVVESEYAKGNIVLGTGSVNHVLGYKNIGSRVFASVEDSVLLGSDNTISYPSSYLRAGYDATESNIFEIGNSLHNDARQNKEMDDNEVDRRKRPTTIILGKNNQNYYQPDQVKLMVLGGYRSPKWTGIPNFSYNSLEMAVSTTRIPNAENLEDEYGNPIPQIHRESLMTIMDVKGRTIDYGSGGINLGYMSDSHRNDQSYEEYRFSPKGRINLFKLYQLLRRMYWSDDGTVRYRYGVDENPNHMPWSDYDRWAGTTLANLVDDGYAQYPYQPQKPAGE